METSRFQLNQRWRPSSPPPFMSTPSPPLLPPPSVVGTPHFRALAEEALRLLAGWEAWQVVRAPTPPASGTTGSLSSVAGPGACAPCFQERPVFNRPVWGAGRGPLTRKALLMEKGEWTLQAFSREAGIQHFPSQGAGGGVRRGGGGEGCWPRQVAPQGSQEEQVCQALCRGRPLTR